MVAFPFDGGDVSPAKDGGTPSEAAAEGDHEQIVANARRLGGDEFGQGQRHGGGAGVAVAIDVDVNSVGLDAQGFLGGGNDARVGLMRNDGVNVVQSSAWP